MIDDKNVLEGADAQLSAEELDTKIEKLSKVTVVTVVTAQTVNISFIQQTFVTIVVFIVDPR